MNAGYQSEITTLKNIVSQQAQELKDAELKWSRRSEELLKQMELCSRGLKDLKLERLDFEQTIKQMEGEKTSQDAELYKRDKRICTLEEEAIVLSGLKGQVRTLEKRLEGQDDLERKYKALHIEHDANLADKKNIELLLEQQTRANNFQIKKLRLTNVKSRRQHLQLLEKLRQDVSILKEDRESTRYRIENTFQKWAHYHRSKLEGLVFKIKEHELESKVARARYKKETLLRKKYFNEVQELRGNIRIFVRVRPWNSNDAQIPGNSIVIKCNPLAEELVVTESRGKNNFCVQSKVFEFECVFSETATQHEVFEKGTKDLITSALDGYNVSILAYGQTGSGKTYTMNGKEGTSWKHHETGLYFRALKEMFRLKSERRPDISYEFTVSVLEIYNENIRDLLGPKIPYPEEADLGLRKRPSYLKLRYIDGDMFIEDLTAIRCESFEDVVVAMERGQSNRSVGVTNMNQYSSRSHSIVRITITGENRVTKTETVAILNFIDLAGSERIHKSGSWGVQMREASLINRSLSALGNVIEAIKRKQSHVPYRDSKLTYLLQECLGGKSKVAMFINLSPTSATVEESLCSLNFGKRARAAELGRVSRTVRRTSKSYRSKRGKS